MASLEVSEREIEYVGCSLRVFVVRVNGEVLSESFAPFDAASDELNLGICEECYAATRGSIMSCGGPDYAVRRHADTIYWFLTKGGWDPEEDDWCNNARDYDPTVDRDWKAINVLEFTVRDYETQVQGSSAGLPDFSADDLRLLLNRCRLFPWQLGLYTIPDLDGDSQGRLLLRGISQFVRKSEIALAMAPERFRTIRVGIETPGIPEVVFDLGESTQGIAIRLLENPNCPFWLTSPDLAELIHA